MSSLFHNVFSSIRRPDSAVHQGHELERGDLSSSQLTETPLPSPVDTPDPSSHRSIAISGPGIQQGGRDDTGLNIISPSSYSPTALKEQHTTRGASNIIQVVDRETGDHRQRSQPEFMPNGILLSESESAYGTNGVPTSPTSSSPISRKRIGRSKRFKHFGGLFKSSQLSSSSGQERKLRLSKFNPSLVLENSGSVARDHLASERTFLAYVRTSLALASMGVAIVQLFTIADLASNGANAPTFATSKKVQKFARPLGVTTVLLALIVLSIGKSHQPHLQVQQFSTSLQP